MSTVVENPPVSPEGLQELPDQKGFELVDGELVERKVSVLSSWIGLPLARLIGNYVDLHRLGWVFGSDNGFQCFADRPDLIRRPDFSFVRASRMTWGEVAEGWLQVVPDLVVEVIPPGD